MMCAQSKLTYTHLAACSHNFPRSQRAEELHSRAFVTSTCYGFCAVHFCQMDGYFNWLIFFFTVSKTLLKGYDTVALLAFPLIAIYLYFMEWSPLLDESDSPISVLDSTSSS